MALIQTLKPSKKIKVFIDSSVLMASAISPSGSARELINLGFTNAPIVAGAMSSKADYLVSYDRKHLLQYKKEIKAHFKIKVVTPDQLVK